MEKNKSNLTLILCFSFFLIFYFFPINAEEQDQILKVICNFAGWIKNLLMAIGIISALFGGYKILTAGGDPGRMEDAKKIILIALVGMAVISGISTVFEKTGVTKVCNNI